MKKLPIFVALDVDEESKAIQLAKKLSPYVLGFKIGPRLFFKNHFMIQKLSSYGEVFLDFKFFDIPSTMQASVRASFEMGAKYVTVHGVAGFRALFLLAQVEKEFLNKGRVLVVTKLTSETHSHIAQQVMEIAEQVKQSGLTGLVASAKEVQTLRKSFPHFFIVTPGIRLEDHHQTHQKDDQVRTATPLTAIQNGASALVIGRPILQASDPIEVVQKISQSLNIQG